MTADNNSASQNPGCLGNLRILKKPPEAPVESILLRVICFITVIISDTAALTMLDWPSWGIIIYPAEALGYFISHKLRYKRTWPIKICITFFMLWVLREFFHDLSMSLEDPREPLAKLLLLLHAGHCFDVPRLRDINYSLIVGLALLGFSAVMTPDMSLGIYIALFGIFFIYALRLCHIEREGAKSKLIIKRRTVHKASFLSLAKSFPAILVAITATFLILAYTPRGKVNYFQIFPTSWNIKLKFPQRSTGGIISPADGTSFFGQRNRKILSDDEISTSAEIDLDFRGEPLGDDIVMRVRSSAPVNCRGLGFSHYDGHHWSVSERKPRKLEMEMQSFIIPARFASKLIPPVYQTFIIQKDLSNIIFTPHKSTQLFFPADNIYIDSTESLRAPYMLEKDMVYTAMGVPCFINDKILLYAERRQKKRREAREQDRLKQILLGQKPDDDIDKYPPSFQEFLQLPDTVTARTYELAKKLTEDKTNNFRKAEAIAEFLRKYEYQLVPPEYPQDKDSADWFLFEAKRGNCQQFATALTVLCRAANVPARFVYGYVLGDYNPLTGYYNVHEYNAHAWTEIFMPELGWIDIDATPAMGSNDLRLDNLNQDGHSLFSDLLSFTHFDKTAAKTYNVTIDWLRSHISIVLPLLFLATAITLAVFVRKRLTQARLEKKYGFITYAAEQFTKKVAKLFNAATDNKDYISRLYAEMLYVLDRQGFVRPPSQTPRSFANDNDSLSSCEALKNLTAMLEEEQYGNIATDDSRREQAERYLQDIQSFCNDAKPTNSSINTNTNADLPAEEK
ncbi:MAG: DUF3488 and transglutaminase-like domain-containing protein [bacterium]|nr:DUF3488 and transglutaminase-like domain-containing protein [bacterium]